jgi:hypothetical protein
MEVTGDSFAQQDEPEKSRRESTNARDSLGAMPDFDGGHGPDSMSTMTLSGAMGASLAQEVRKELVRKATADAPF